MKEDYLWDKTGTDPAIEKLESALSAFSYDESALQMPVSIAVPVEKRGYFRFLSFGFAAAACLAIALISWAVWNRASVRNSAPPEQVLTVVPGTGVPPPKELAVVTPDMAVINDIESPRSRAPRVRTARKPAGRVAVAARSSRGKPNTENLTKEEIYAYNRLMLALSITSDKLNLVKEKIAGE